MKTVAVVIAMIAVALASPCFDIVGELPCNGDRACWYNSTSRSCAPSPCKSYMQEACANVSYCNWFVNGTDNVGHCANGTTPNCAWYLTAVSCPVNRCTWNQSAPNGTRCGDGVSPICSSFRTEPECPPSRCHWWVNATSQQAACRYGPPPPPPPPRMWCVNATNETACAAMQDCQWTPNGCYNASNIPPSNGTECGRFMKENECPTATCHWWFNATSQQGWCRNGPAPPPPAPCDTFNASTCPQSRCHWATQAGSTTSGYCAEGPATHPPASPPPAPMGCGSFVTASQCIEGRCEWVPNVNVCIPPAMPCSQTQNATVCASRLGCVWDGLARTCAERPCESIREATNCNNRTRCWWSPLNTCVPKPCTAYIGNPEHCTGGCMYDQERRLCRPRACGSINSVAACLDNNRCRFANGACFQPTCRSFTTLSQCPVDTYCTLQRGETKTTAADGSTVTSITTLCVDRGCRLYDPNITSGGVWGAVVGCLADPNCKYSNDTINGPMCEQKACDAFNTEASGSAAGSFANCPSPCRFNFTVDRCQRLPCSSFTTADTCPTTSGVCGWDANLFGGVCLEAKCYPRRGGVMPQEECVNRGCVYNTALSQTSPCFDPALFHLPCFVYPTDRCPLALPSGRCSVIPVNSTFSICANANAQPCFRYTTANCPTYCRVAFEQCFNPQCVEITNNRTCAERGCRWVASHTACVDPNAFDNFPCASFTAALCPTFRCQISRDPASNTATCAGFAPVTQAPQSCADFTELQSCMYAPLGCYWFSDRKVCDRPPCSAYEPATCPELRCRVFGTSCVDPCPSNRSFVCPTGLCAENKDQCVRCPSGQVQCWDTSCVSSFDLCPCPRFSPFKCPNGRCALFEGNCSTSCAAETPVVCWNNECAATKDDCPCPVSSPISCTRPTGERICVTSDAECTRTCPSVTPALCWNGDCAVSPLACPCSPNQPLRCPTTRACVSNLTHCPCPTDEASFRCTIDRCAASATACAAQPTTCQGGQHQCSNGECVTDRSACGCSILQRNASVPQITINALEGRFDMTNWFRVASVVSFWVCGQDISLTARVQWTAVEFASGAPVVGADGAVARVFGLAAAIPPNFFQREGVDYLLIATVQGYNGVSIVSASASIVITGFRPQPKLSMIGGTHRSASYQELQLAVEIKDPSPTQGVPSWRCCVDAECLDECPANITTQLNTQQTAFVRLMGPLPAGNFTFHVYYKGVSASQTVTIVDHRVPTISIVTAVRDVFSSDAIMVYAIVRFHTSFQLHWLLNDTDVIATGNTTIWIPANRLPALWGTRLTARAVSGDAVGLSSITIRPLAPLVGACTVAPADSSIPSTSIVALQTALRIEVRVDNLPNDADVKYRFAYHDMLAGMADKREFVLSSFFQELPYYDFRAPMPVGNPASRSIDFFAGIQYGARNNLIIMRCNSLTINRPNDAATAIAKQKDEIRAAANSSDTGVVVRAAQNLASAITQESNRTLVAETVRTITSALHAAVANNSATLSTSERANAIGALLTLATRPEAKKGDFVDNETEVVEVLRGVMTRKQCSISSTGRDNDCDGVDTRTQGGAALTVLAQLNTTRQVGDLVEKLSRDVANDLSLGERLRFTAGNLTIEGSRRSATDLGNQTVGTGNTEMRLPDAFNIPGTNETTIVGLSAAAFKENPVGVRGKPPTMNLSSPVVDFTIQVDGEERAIANLSTPLDICLQLDASVNATNATTVKLMYFDKRQESWSDYGVTMSRVKDGQVCGKTNHLSTFGAFSDNAPAGTQAPPPPPGPNPTPAPPGTTPNGGGATPAPATNGGGSTPVPATNGGGPTPVPSPGASGSPGPSGSPSPSNSTPAPGGNAAPDAEGTDATTAAIVGGVIGGVLLLAIVAGVVVKRNQAATGTGFREEGVPLNDVTEAPSIAQIGSELQRRQRTPYDEL